MTAIHDAGNTEEPEILIRQEGRLGHIVLNRPRAVNALTHTMVTAIEEALTLWAEDDTVTTVLVSGAGERGLCAGGDIVAIYHDAVAGGEATARFWADEYRLNSLIASYPKPYIALMDGLVLGGGVGISVHGSIRIVTERTKLGMPETGIGFVPDVGGTYLLSRAPGELGTHLALTAGSISGSDVIALGLADHYTDSGRLPALIAELSVTEASQAVATVARDYFPPSALSGHRSWIDECYAFDTVEEILAALQNSDIPAAQAAAQAILTKSPTALKLTLESLRRAADLDTLEEVLEQEYRVSVRQLRGKDFPEGIRAQVIDKDRNPQWSPSKLEDVDSRVVGESFLELGDHDLWLTARPQDASR